MAKGDHIYVHGMAHGIPYQHHGIDMGDGTVVHLAPVSGARIALRDASNRFTIRRDSLKDFCREASPVLVKHDPALAADHIVAKAESLIGNSGYSLLNGNCEHFARLCASGRSESHQVDMGAATVSAFASMATKACWALGSKLGGRLAIRTVTRVHPAALIADGVEVLTLAISCRRGLTAVQSRKVARLSSSVAAVGIGAVVGGPAGAVVALATHSSSTAFADRLCEIVREKLS